MPAQKNPAELKPTLLFGALYAVVLLAVAPPSSISARGALYHPYHLESDGLARHHVSTGQLADSDKIEANTAWRVILVALLSNLLFKFGIVSALGPPSLTKRIGLATAAAVAAGLGILLLWPG